MKYENYFDNVPKYGNLDIEEIIFEDSFPVFFTAKSCDFQRFICICCDIVKEQRWIIAPISNTDLIKLLTNQLTMYESFLINGECIIARWSKEKPVLRYELVSSSDIDIKDLPVEGEYIESETDEYASYISSISDSIMNFNFTPVNTTVVNIYKKKNNYSLSEFLYSKLVDLLKNNQRTNVTFQNNEYNVGELKWVLN